MSLDKNRDGPFALLAKENDIMWGGGQWLGLVLQAANRWLRVRVRIRDGPFTLLAKENGIMWGGG
jgi:hypothetical protein